MKKKALKGFLVPDGNETLRTDIPAVAELIARTARWVHPETFRALPVWAPHAARGMPLFDASWSRQYTNTKKATGIKSDKFEGNVAAAHALFAALDVASPRPKNWAVCHIWGYDDPAFAQHSGVVQDRRYFSCVANMVWLPTSLKGFTDTLPEIKAMLRTCAFHLYGWACEHPSVAEQAAEVRSGRIPPDYPAEWPLGKSPGQLPPGTAPFTERVQLAIAKRKAKITSDLKNAAYIHYPKSEVERVLKFWNVDLG
ncbi:hypothetical protein [Bradyrhizobium sp. AZCC 1699]|uniref:hypothetical protein n=1 Tax=Bradyrhizobium sp. AZCC 1699 TaxID=3117024 RepID=UPI002FF3FCB3